MSKGLCVVAECGKPHMARGYCDTHYKRWKAHGTAELAARPTLADRFWAKVDTSGDCWLWTGGTANGYGQFYPSHSQPRGAHRVSYELAVGPIPEGLVIDHLCRVPLCVNPRHLEAVTERVNILRGEAPSARAVRENVCTRGHEFDDDNTYVDGEGKRHCRACRVLAERRRPTRRQHSSGPRLSTRAKNAAFSKEVAP